MPHLLPLRTVATVIPRLDILKAAIDARTMHPSDLARLGLPKPGREVWNKSRPNVGYSTPVVYGTDNFIPVELVDIGPETCDRLLIQPGDILGVDIGQVKHSFTMNDVVHWTISSEELLCLFPRERDCPVAIGEHALTIQDQETQEKVRTGKAPTIHLTGETDGLLSDGRKNGSKILFEKILSTGDPTSRAHRDVFGDLPELTGATLMFAPYCSVTIRMFSTRLRIINWSKCDGIYVP